MHNVLHRLWLRVQEPRALSVIYFFAYVAVTVVGLAVAADPPRSVQGTIGHTLMIVWSLLLLVGGVVGAGSVLQGAWWLERVGAIACGFAMLIYGVAITGLPATQISLRIATLSFIIFAALAFAARLVKVSRYAYDPEK
ncbi:lysylphosphatidylglycerol synthetase-like protein (DUF2156 family) [Arthrobacter sp. V4I6]|uniref:hypothetical protein n=1 Tax=Arthrobacter sp. V4I6 TaxID=3042281 RepID=UPI002787AAFD|nr:hypothetical protein [Arthrobacter sp. V4I6]MDQ0854771.1 lysylphosphatidylglycerol synthetase-like protein (DUF2156 family) [Arthrobacter sp. V4I6]